MSSSEKKRRLIYVIGEPGVGKSTVVKEAARRLGIEPRREPNRWRLVAYIGRQGVWILGDYTPNRGAFGGTDALSMAVMPDAKEFLRVASGSGNGPHAIVGEGDRLASVDFFRAADEAGWEVRLVMLTASVDEVARRRAARAGAGKKQDETWLRGRSTKVADLFRAATVEFPAVMHPVRVESRAGTRMATDLIMQLATEGRG